jgi:capsule polysaccharide export protein KpsE/RkpR
MTPIKPYLTRAIELIEAIEDTQKQADECRSVAKVTDISDYAEVNRKLAVGFDRSVTRLKAQLETVKSEILKLWHE